jgi:integrase
VNPVRFGRFRHKCRTFVQPEQLPSLLDASEGLLRGRGRPLAATLAGAGLRIGEALALEWRDFDRAKGTLRVWRSKTDAGVRLVDLTLALREELGDWKDRTKHGRPGDLIFGTAEGKPDNRNNVRRRLLVKAIERANARLADL